MGALRLGGSVHDTSLGKSRSKRTRSPPKTSIPFTCTDTPRQIAQFEQFVVEWCLASSRSLIELLAGFTKLFVPLSAGERLGHLIRVRGYDVQAGFRGSQTELAGSL